MSDDLISRKAVLELLFKDGEWCTDISTIYERVENLKTAFEKEKVIEEMKKTGKRFCVSVRCSEDCQNCEHGVLMKALIEIVEKGGIE